MPRLLQDRKKLEGAWEGEGGRGRGRMERDEEIVVRERFEESVQSLKGDKRFLAIVDYVQFIYKKKLEDYDFSNYEDALRGVGHKDCLRGVIQDFEDNMVEIPEHVEALY